MSFRHSRSVHERRSAVQRRNGAALIETAIILPLLLTLSYACVDFGRVVNAYATVGNAARCGADYATTHRFQADTQAAWEAAVRTACLTELQSYDAYDPTAATVTTTFTTDALGLRRVTVRCEYEFRTVVAWLGIPGTIRLKHELVARQIR